LTFNEEANIGRTLAALSWIERIMVLDSHSTDRTVDLIRHTRADAMIVERAFDTHTRQWNFGLDQVTTEWVLTLDADYELSPEIQAEIGRLDPPADLVGYAAEFEYKIFGRSIRASSYPRRVVLFRVRRARYIDDGHTQLLRPDGRVDRLENKIYHDDRKALSHWIRSQDRYARIEARHLLRDRGTEIEGRGEALSFQDRLRLKIFFAPPIMFLYLLFVRGLVLDGWPGWYYVMQRTIAEMLLSLRLLTEREKLEESE
jgi:glycosyltransferase involved in cell wall biosynthesis